MSSNTKIVVLHLKELIYTGIFAILGILFVILLVIMFIPRDKKEISSSDVTPTATYVHGVYTTSLILNDKTVDVEVTVDETNINDIQMINLDDAVATMFPLLEPSFDDLAGQILRSQSLESITYADDNAFFLKCTGNSNARGWGQSGQNGADCHFTAKNQEMEGDIIWDSISQLDFYILDGSSLTGAVLDDETNAGSGGDGYANVYLSADSTWVVTNDSTITSLQNEGKIVDTDGKTVSIKGTDGTVYVDGTSQYVITVESYQDTVDL